MNAVRFTKGAEKWSRAQHFNDYKPRCESRWLPPGDPEWALLHCSRPAGHLGRHEAAQWIYMVRYVFTFSNDVTWWRLSAWWQTGSDQ